MSGKRLSPEQRSEAVALRAAGYTLAVIAERIGVSTRTMTRLFSQCQVKPEPIGAEMVRRVRERMLAEMSAPEAVKSAVGASVLDDLAHARFIRVKALEVLESLEVSDQVSARECAKALGSVAQTLKVTQAVTRIALGADDRDDMEPTAVLVVREMTAEDVARARAASRSSELADTDDV